MDRREQQITEVDVTSAAASRLQRSPYAALRRVQCRYERNRLILSGTLPSYFHKQLAQETLADLVGVEQLVNEIEVIADDLTGQSAFSKPDEGRKAR